MIEIYALDYCFLIFPQFKKEFDFLQKIGVIKYIDKDNCKWLKSEICLIEYFHFIDTWFTTSAKNWQPIELLFGLKKGSLKKIVKEAGKNPALSEEYKKLKTKLNNFWNSKIKIPDHTIDLNIYRYLMTEEGVLKLRNFIINNSDNSTDTVENNYENNRKDEKIEDKPTIKDYCVSYDLCIKLFEYKWQSIFHVSVYGSLDDYFGELAFNVYLRKREEMTSLLIECVKEEYNDKEVNIKPSELKKIFSEYVEPKIEINKKLNYIQKLIDKGHLMPDGLRVVNSLDDVAQALNLYVPINAQLLSQFRQANGKEFAKKTLITVANRVKNSKL